MTYRPFAYVGGTGVRANNQDGTSAAKEGSLDEDKDAADDNDPWKDGVGGSDGIAHTVAFWPWSV